MTFKETDFPSLVQYIKNFVEKEEDPILLKDVLMQLVQLYDKVPLYPGIVNMCLGGVAKQVKPEDVVVGQKIYLRNRSDSYCGTVVSKDADGVTLSGVKSVTTEDELEIGFKEMEQVSYINDKVFQEMWPSLVFDKETK